MGRKKILTDEQMLKRFFEKRLLFGKARKKVHEDDELNVWLDIDDWLEICTAATKREIERKLFLQMCRQFGVKKEITRSGRECFYLDMKRYSSLWNMKLYQLYFHMCT